MPTFMNQTTNVTLDNLTSLSNFSDITGFFQNVNSVVYGDILFIILLMMLWAVLFISLMRVDNNILQNILYSGILVSITSSFFMALNLVPARLAWAPAIIILIVAAIGWFMKDS